MYIRNEKGAALPLVLILMLVLTTLGTTLLFLTITEAKQVAMEEKKMQAYYLARSGADAVAEYILKNPNDQDFFKKVSKVNDSIVSAPNKLGEKGNFVVNITRSKEDEISILSTGKVDGIYASVCIKLKETETGYKKVLWQ